MTKASANTINPERSSSFACCVLFTVEGNVLIHHIRCISAQLGSALAAFSAIPAREGTLALIWRDLFRYLTPHLCRNVCDFIS